MAMDILYAIIGGSLIGLASSVLLLFNGKIMGISGILEGLAFDRKELKNFYLPAVLGLLTGGLLLLASGFDAFPTLAIAPSLGLTISGGLLVGFGTRLGGGCTSGHGICGLSRFSPRSLVATVSFMGAGMVAATLFNLV